MVLKLVSEDLQERFGEICLKVYTQNPVRRVSALLRRADGAVLTYHVVTFDPRGIAALGTVHDTILSGGSMGDVIKKSGVRHTRKVSVPVAFPIPPKVQKLFKTNRKECKEEIITYTIKGQPYAHIQELYNPEFTKVPARKK